MKIWGSVRQGAGKLAFEADKLVRIKKQEGLISDANKEIQTKLTALGEVALSLYRGGALNQPQVAAIAAEIAQIEQRIAQLQAELEAIRAEEWVDPAAQAAPPPPPVSAQTYYSQPLAPAAQSGEQPPAPPQEEVRRCANCGAPLSPTAVFCSECGARVER